MKSYGADEAPSLEDSFDFGLFDGRGSPPTPRTKSGSRLFRNWRFFGLMVSSLTCQRLGSLRRQAMPRRPRTCPKYESGGTATSL